MQGSQSKILRVTANIPRYVTNHTLHTGLNISYVSEVIHENISNHHNEPEDHPYPLLEPPLQPINTSRLKEMLTFRLARYLIWHRWVNTLPRHSNTRYRSVFVEGDQKLSVHLMITEQKFTSNVKSLPHQSPDIYGRAELRSPRTCSVKHG